MNMLLSVIRWFIAIFLWLMGIISLDEPIMAMFFFMIGLLFFPPLDAWVEKKTGKPFTMGNKISLFFITAIFSNVLFIVVANNEPEQEKIKQYRAS